MRPLDAPVQRTRSTRPFDNPLDPPFLAVEKIKVAPRFSASRAVVLHKGGTRRFFYATPPHGRDKSGPYLSRNELREKEDEFCLCEEQHALKPDNDGPETHEIHTCIVQKNRDSLRIMLRRDLANGAQFIAPV